MLLKLRDKRVTGRLWHIVRLLFTEMKNQVTLGGQSSAHFRIFLGVV
jgi:hypothetical protein